MAEAFWDIVGGFPKVQFVVVCEIGVENAEPPRLD
jgi:hypothetical protein